MMWSDSPPHGPRAKELQNETGDQDAATQDAASCAVGSWTPISFMNSSGHSLARPRARANRHIRPARGALLAILEELSMDQWTRAGRHSQYGRLSLRAWVELFLAHEGHHL